MSSDGLLLMVAAPSGAGKTSLVNALVERDPRVVISVSFTTRAPRPGEEPGRHYHFTDEPAFRAMLENNEFLEHAVVFGNRYGTHRQTTMGLLRQGRDVLLEIDWQGARQVREAFPECRDLFILPPSLETLRRRLGARAQDSQAVIEKRMHEAQAEISHCDEFGSVIVNDEFDQALGEMQDWVEACRAGRSFDSQPHEELLAELLLKR